MIHIALWPATLEALDTVDADGILAGVFRESRPPQGGAGLLDWRLNGRISFLILEGTHGCEAGEAMLIDTGKRVKPPAAILFGMGSVIDWRAKRAAEVATAMLHVGKRAGFTRPLMLWPEAVAASAHADALLAPLYTALAEGTPWERIAALGNRHAWENALASVPGVKKDIRIQIAVPETVLPVPQPEAGPAA